MTVIAYKDGVMAADKLNFNFHGPTASITKIRRIVIEDTEMLVGVAGHTVTAAAVFEWAQGGFKESEMPANQKDPEKRNLILCVVRDDENGHRVYHYENSHVPWRNEEPWTALGAGGDMAAGALAMGADARRAVEVACTHNPVCGMGIDVLKFE